MLVQLLPYSRKVLQILFFFFFKQNVQCLIESAIVRGIRFMRIGSIGSIIFLNSCMSNSGSVWIELIVTETEN